MMKSQREQLEQTFPCLTIESIDKIMEIVNETEPKPCPYIGQLVEVTSQSKCPDIPTRCYLESVNDDGSCKTKGGSSWKHWRPILSINLIPHNRSALPRYEQRCLVLMNRPSGTKFYGDFSWIKAALWLDVVAFLPVDENGNKDQAAIDAEGWLKDEQ